MWGSRFSALQRVSCLAFVSSTRNGASLPIRKTSYSTTPSLKATQYLLKYTYITDVLEKRAPYREEHLGLAKKLIGEGKCVSGGPTGKPGTKVPTGALLIFNDEESAELFVQQDPYVTNNIVTSHSIEEWNVVVRKEE